jgi:hypothetical protein
MYDSLLVSATVREWDWATSTVSYGVSLWVTRGQGFWSGGIRWWVVLPRYHSSHDLIHIEGFLGITRVWNQDLVLARQAHYHLSHTPSPFCSGYFWDRIPLYDLDYDLPICASSYTRMTGMHYCTQPLVEMESYKLPRLVSNHDPPNCHLPSS